MPNLDLIPNYRTGPIYKVTLGGRDRIFISSRELMDELCDETRFVKSIAATLLQLRSIVQDSLFTAYHGEHNWGVAHRILMPAFGPLAVRMMFKGDFAQAS